jgi:hypothetical protein
MATAKRKPTTRDSHAEPQSPAHDELISIAGPPGHLAAEITVENASDTSQAVGSPLLHLPDREPVEGAGASIIRPGETAAIRLSFEVDNTLAPGTYDAELELAGQRRPARVAVLSEISFWVEPTQVVVAPGRQDITLLLTNDGNVRMPLAALTLASAVTDEPGPARVAPGEAGRGEAARGGRRASDVALVLDEPAVVEPGQSLAVSGHLEIPEGLDPARRHIATIPVGVADLDVIILPRATEKRP